MNHQLTITDDDGAEIVKVRLTDVNPITATLTALTALQNIPKPRATRKDAGQPKTKPQHATTT